MLLAAPVSPAVAQGSGAKPRLELADTSRAVARRPDTTSAAPTRATSAPVTDRTGRVGVSPGRPAPATGTSRPGGTPPTPAALPLGRPLRTDFVRNQTILGLVLYAPAFATTFATDDVAWGAGYLVLAGGSFFAAAETSREMTVTDPMQHLATWMPIQGAIAGGMLGTVLDLDRRGRAATVLLASLGGTATGLALGGGMTEGEAAATTFGTNALGLTAFGVATAAGLTTHPDGTANTTRLAITLGGMIAGAPIGQAYAALAPYNVTAGDLTAMSAVAGVGMLTGLTLIAHQDNPSDREVAGVLSVGAVVGLVAGDRLLVRRYDHTLSEGRFVLVGGAAGGLMGAGVALLTGGRNTRWGTTAAGLTTIGAAGGIALAQRYAEPKADGGLRVGALLLNPAAVVAAASGMAGTYTLGSIRF